MMKHNRMVTILVLLAVLVFSLPVTAQDSALKILGPWLATEADAFEAVLDGFRSSTGIEVVYEGNKDVLGPLATRIAAGSPPEIAILPVAGGLKSLVDQNAVIPLDGFSDMIAANFDAGWINQFTFNGHIYAVPTRSNLQNVLWYNPAVVGTAPASWAEFTAYCDSVAANGQSCVAGLGKDAWTLNLLFQSVFVATNGLEKWTALGTGEIPLNDPSMVETFNRIAQFYGDKYAAGGSAGALGTGLVDGIARVFGTNADAQFVNAGSWAGGIAIGAVNNQLVEGETIDYTMFPGEEISAGEIVASADVAIMLVDNPDAQQLLSYLASAEGQALFAPSGYTVANKNVSSSLYTGLTARTAELLATSQVGPDVNVLLTRDTLTLVNEAISAAILDPEGIQSILDDLQASVS